MNLVVISSAEECALKGGVMINSVCWATRNVDAPGTFAANPEDYGMYYQWNRSLGWSTNDPLTASDGVSSWDKNYAGGTSWSTANDVCPTGWRIPTTGEQTNLWTVQTKTWTTQNGAAGYKFTAKKAFDNQQIAGQARNDNRPFCTFETASYLQ